jgi:hypothetical protein
MGLSHGSILLDVFELVNCISDGVKLCVTAVELDQV